jgi:hypothetical protein
MELATQPRCFEVFAVVLDGCGGSLRASYAKRIIKYERVIVKYNLGAR